MESETKEIKLQEGNCNSSVNSGCSKMTGTRSRNDETTKSFNKKQDKDISAKCHSYDKGSERDENPKYQNSTSEMREFWDFLTEIKDIKDELNESEMHENELPDFLKPDCSVTDPHFKKRPTEKNSFESKMLCTVDSGVGKSTHKSSERSNDFNQEKESTKSKGTESSPSAEDPFWDFLNIKTSETKTSNSDDEFWDFIYSKSNQQKAVESEDEFWDFLKTDSPDELRDVVKSITDSIQPTPRSDASLTDTPMSLPPFSVFTSLQTGIKTSTPIVKTGTSNVVLNCSKGANIRNSKYEIITSLPQKCTFGSKAINNQTEGITSRGNLAESSFLSDSNLASTDKSKAIVTEKGSGKGGNLPCCISSVYSMQPYNSTGKVVTEVFPSSVGYTLSNSIVQSSSFPQMLARTSKNASAFIQEKNKTFSLTKVVSGKKITNVFPIRKNVMNKNLKVERVNRISLPNKTQVFPPPNIKTLNESKCNSFLSDTQNNSCKTQDVTSQTSQVSSGNIVPRLINTSQTNPIKSSELQNNANPLYFLVPGNSESFKNPNYSHYFVVVNNNNNNLPNQPPEVNTTQNQNFIGKTTTSSTTVSANQSVSIGQSTSFSVARQMMFSKPLYVQSQSSNSGAQGVGSNTSIKVVDQNQMKNVSVPNSSVVNLTDVPNSSASSLNQQYSKNILQSNAMTNVNYIPVTSILLKEPLLPLKNAEVSNQTLPLAINDSNAPNITVPKPIKSIPLGENKNAILQLSVPEKMGGASDAEVLETLRNNSVMPPLKVPLRLGPQGQAPGEHPLKNQDVLKPITKYTLLSDQQILSNYQQSNQDLSFASKGLDGVATVSNPPVINQPFQTYSLSLNINNPVMKQANASLTNNMNTVNLANLVQKEKMVKPNQYVQVKLAPPPNTVQGPLSTPVSMVPISIVQPTSSSCQPRVSKVLVLKGQTAQGNPILTTRRPNSTRLSGKSKKNGPKTVRQLLEEYRKKQMEQGPRPQKPILRRILKMPVNTAYNGTLPGTLKAGPTNYAFNTTNVISKKRPNILVLPSASKHIKKNVIRDNVTKNFVTRRELDFTGSSTNYNGECDSYLNGSDNPFSSDKRDFRPRHYDMSELQIGFFKVEDDIEYSCGRFRSKFKVLFSKCQFLYDFPMSRCNRMDLKSSHIWEKRIRVVVPFKTITSMDMRERIINIHLNQSPLIYLGRVQAKAGIISNTIVYDTLIEDGSQWGDDIKNTLTHKIVLRKRQASKLKTSLCEFDDNFVLLTNAQELGASSAIGCSTAEDSSDSNKKDALKNQKLRIRRLSRWNSPGDDEEEEDEEQLNSDDMSLLENKMCSCRISCRSIRCSCVKAARSCRSSSLCLCVSCDNPLNLLEALGMDIEFSLSDSCLFQNIYPIPKLADFLKRELQLACCNTFARVQDCIPGTVLCPNVNCNVHLEFSWCRGIVCYPQRNPRNHCSFCGQCCFSNKRHCFTCRRCYIISPKIPFCPSCKEISPLCTDMLNSSSTLFPTMVSNQKSSNPPPKPEIILLDAATKPTTDEGQNTSDEKVDKAQVSEIQDMITIESPKKDDQVLLEYAATL